MVKVLAQYLTAGAFAAQAGVHWAFGSCPQRGAPHQQLGGAAALIAAVAYLGMACGIFQGRAASSASSESRPFFHLQYLERALGPSILLLNLATLARERRSSSGALVAAWCTQVLALYLGQLAQVGQRWLFLLASIASLACVGISLCAAMGGRLHQSPLMTDPLQQGLPAGGDDNLLMRLGLLHPFPLQPGLALC
ncbi:unnamed protein product [Effrenium voratum]|nr:unnamed protein product [Effrenium voratum]